jgi:hypothetical protein
MKDFRVYDTQLSFFSSKHLRRKERYCVLCVLCVGGTGRRGAWHVAFQTTVSVPENFPLSGAVSLFAQWSKLSLPPWEQNTLCSDGTFTFLHVRIHTHTHTHIKTHLLLPPFFTAVAATRPHALKTPGKKKPTASLPSPAYPSPQQAWYAHEMARRAHALDVAFACCSFLVIATNAASVKPRVSLCDGCRSAWQASVTFLSICLYLCFFFVYVCMYVYVCLCDSRCTFLDCFWMHVCMLV